MQKLTYVCKIFFAAFFQKNLDFSLYFVARSLTIKKNHMKIDKNNNIRETLTFMSATILNLQ